MEKIRYSFENFDVEVLAENTRKFDEYFLCYIKTTEDNKPNCKNKMFYWCRKNDFLTNKYESIEFVLVGPCFEGTIQPINSLDRVIKYCSRDEFIFEDRAIKHKL